jgi:hypothetical protein
MSKSKSFQRVTISAYLARALFGEQILSWMFPKPFTYSEHTANRYLTHNDDAALTDVFFDWMNRFFKEQTITAPKEKLYPYTLFPADVIVTGLHKDLPMHIAVDVAYYNTNPLDTLKETVDFISLHKGETLQSVLDLSFFHEPGIAAAKSRETTSNGGRDERQFRQRVFSSLVSGLNEAKRMPTIKVGTNLQDSLNAKVDKTIYLAAVSPEWFELNMRNLYLAACREVTFGGLKPRKSSDVINWLQKYISATDVLHSIVDHVTTQTFKIVWIDTKRSDMEVIYVGTILESQLQPKQEEPIGTSTLNRCCETAVGLDKMLTEFKSEFSDITLEQKLTEMSDAVKQWLSASRRFQVKQFAHIKGCEFKLSMDDFKRTFGADFPQIVSLRTPSSLFSFLQELDGHSMTLLRGGILLEGKLVGSGFPRETTVIFTNESKLTFKPKGFSNELTVDVTDKRKRLLSDYFNLFNSSK